MLERFLEPETRVLDVGTGGGVPGMVLAIMRPDLSMTLSESVAKRAVAATAIVQTAAPGHSRLGLVDKRYRRSWQICSG